MIESSVIARLIEPSYFEDEELEERGAFAKAERIMALEDVSIYNIARIIDSRVGGDHPHNSEADLASNIAVARACRVALYMDDPDGFED